MIGYGAGDYGWPKRGRLSILVNANAILRGDAKTDNPMPGAYLELRVVAGMSRKRIAEILGSIPKKGLARPVARAPSVSNEMQMELV
jgi:hypothetical protein